MTGIQRRRYCRIFLGFLIISCWNSSISTPNSHSGYQSSLRSSAMSDDSWEIIWKDDFEITHIWGDDSHLFTGAQYGYYGSYTRNKLLIQKWDKNGNILKNYTWDPGFENVYLEGIWGNTNSVSISGYLVDSYIDGNDSISYANGFLVHFDKNLTLKWIRTWNNSLTAGFFDVWCNEQSIFAGGITRINNSTREVVLTKWDMNGQQKWNITYNPFCHSGYYSRLLGIMGDNDSIYTNLIRSTYSEASQILTKWSSGGDFIWNHTHIIGNRGNGNEVNGEIWVVEDNFYTLLDISGQTLTFTPYRYSPILRKWDAEGNLIWEQVDVPVQYYREATIPLLSTIWSDGMGIYVGTDQKINDLETEFLLIHYDENGTKLWENSWNWHGHTIHTHTIYLWGDNQSMYSVGQIYDLKSPIYDGVLNYLIKWSAPHKVNLILIIGLSTGGFIIVIAISWVLIKRFRH